MTRPNKNLAALREDILMQLTHWRAKDSMSLKDEDARVAA